MTFSSAALIAVALPNILIGLTVLLRNIKNITNISFMFFVAFVALWSGGLAGFTEAHDNSSALYWSKLYYIAATGIAVSLFIFCRNYLSDRQSSIIMTAMYALPAVLITVLILLIPNFLTDSIAGNHGNREVILNPLHYLIYTIVFVFYFFSAIAKLNRRISNVSGNNAIHLRLVLTGVLLAGVLGMFFNLFLPWLGNYRLIWVGPQFSVIMVGFIAYGILRHRLFDIRAVIARSFAYITSFTFIGLIFAITFNLLVTFLFDRNPPVQEILLITTLMWFFAVLYQPFKRLFDRITGDLFYRERYDSQVILDKLSSLLATEINLKTIVEKSSVLINGALNPSYLRFVVFKDGEAFIDEGGENNQRAVLRPEIDNFSDVLIIRDEADEKAKEFLDLYDADVLLKLRTNEETVGAILLGPKQSGTVYSKQDIDLLAISEKELAIAVQNARYFEQIQEFNVKLQQEVEQATSELRASNEKLKALDEAKDEFISMASHQLRTPLTSVKGYISMIADGDAGRVKPEQKRLLDEAFASSQRMVYLIADLLNVSRMRTGKFVVEPSKVNLADIVEEEIKQLKPTINARRLKITFDKPQNLPLVMLDATKIRQVIMNFIDNAIYYTPAGGQIDVRLAARKDRLEYTVKDNGIGVPKEDHAKLFTKFFRASNARKARPDGTGLGLYMAQRVVSAQGGSIIFKSAKDKGSTFGFMFPLQNIKVKTAK